MYTDYHTTPVHTGQQQLAFAYFRFSSKKQELGDSLTRQLHAATQWCAFNGVKLSELSFEDLGVSAFCEGGKRPALADMIRCVREGVIPKGSYVLLENSDRLSRQGFKVALDYVHELVQMGVYIVTLSNGQVFSKDNITELSAMLPLLLDADRGRAESVRKSNLIKSAKKSLRESRVAKGKLPWWLTAIDGKPTLNEYADIAREMADMRLQNISAQSIAKHFNEKGILYNGKPWKAITISASMKNKLLYGCKVYTEVINGVMKPIEEVEGWAPAVISKGLYNAIQPKARSGKGSLTRSSPFTGLLRCPDCGGAMQKKTQKHKGKAYSYKRCLNYGEGRCVNKSNFKEPDSIAQQALLHLKKVEFSAEAPSLDGEQLIALTNKLESLNASKAYITNPVALGKMFDEIVETEEAISVLKAKIEISSNQTNSMTFKPIFDLAPLEANAELKRIIKCIHLYKVNLTQDKYVVSYHNGHKHTFLVDHKRGGRWTTSSWQIKFESDTVKVKQQLNEFVEEAVGQLQPWELDMDS